MANENLLFRKGTLAQLQANESTNKVAGSINFTTDEPAIYLDIEEDGQVVRKRVGDLITFDKIEDFQAYLDSHTKLPLTALYYITESNALLKYTGEAGTPWKQLNNISNVSQDVSNLQSSVSNLSSSLSALSSNVYKKDEMDTALGQKADTETVTEALNQKADTETVNEALNQKANSTDLNNLSSAVNVISSDYLKNADKESLTNSIDLAQQQADKGVADAATAQAAAQKAQDEVDALETVVSNLNSTIIATYETKTEATNKLNEAKQAVTDLSTGQVATNTQNIANEISRAEQAEQALGSRIDGVSTDLNNLNSTLITTIGTAKQEAIDTVIGTEEDTKESDTIYGIRKYVDNALITADAMTFKGVLGGTGNISSLPDATEVKAGDTYKIGLIGTYAGYDCFVGDLLVAKEDRKDEYYHITSGYEDDYNACLGVDAENNKVILNSATGVDHGSVKFIADSDSSVAVSITGTEDPISHIANSTVTISITWGNF